MNVRLKGNYKAIKDFYAGLLKGNHQLALNSLSIRRSAGSDAVLDSEAQLTFYYTPDNDSY